MMLSCPHLDQGGCALFKRVLTPPHCLILGLYTSHKALEVVEQSATALRFLSAHFNAVLIHSPAARQLVVSGFCVNMCHFILAPLS